MVVMFLVGCSDTSDFAGQGTCQGVQTVSGVTLYCPGESPLYVNNGAQGADGTSCTVTQTDGGADVTCGSNTVSISNGTAGSTGATGAQGPAGPQGPQGLPGSNGSPGSNGTSITIVQFCPNVVTTYPSTFAEVGLCIGGNLFAVYSANDGFLSYIPPGTYFSNGINASCTFHVGNNCEVTY